MSTSTKKGYVNGSDMLLYIDGKPVGHCTTHTTTVNTETKDRAVKPVATAPISAGLFKEKGIIGISVSINADGLVCYEETESGYKKCLAKVFEGQSVEVKCMERAETGSSESATQKPYLSGKFVITSLERTDPGQDDATYKVTLENDGIVTIDEEALTENAA